MNYATAQEAIRVIRAANLVDHCCAKQDNKGGWLIVTKDKHEPLSSAQDARVREVPGQQGYVPADQREPRVRAPVAKRDTVEPDDVRERAKRGSIMPVVREVYELHKGDKAAYLAECAKRGIYEGTAKVKWSIMSREEK
jgi:hypothetical protein